MDTEYSTYSYRRMNRSRRSIHPIWTIVLLIVIFKVLTSAIFWKFILGIGAFFFALKMINSYNKVSNEASGPTNRSSRFQREKADYVAYEKKETRSYQDEEEEDFYFDLNDQPETNDDLSEIISEKHKMFK